MGVASGCGEQEVGVASGSGWNLWVWLLGVVLRRSICDPLRENQPYAKKKNFFFLGISYYLYRMYNRCKFEMDIFFFD